MSVFHFKKFSINQEGAPFKVGTDSVILGSWTSVEGDETVLDIGTGTGVLGLMIAQKLKSGRVLAIEPEREAFEVAERNIQNSPYSQFVIAVNEPLQRIKTTEKFDLIISNPPYFISSTKNPNDSSRRARHTDELSFSEIISFSRDQLSKKGRLVVVLPVMESRLFEEQAKAKGIYLVKELQISSFVDTVVKRRCMEFSLLERALKSESLVIRNREDQKYTDGYKKMTAEYHSHF